MITGIPDYTSPIEQSLRCPCGLLYVVYIGDDISSDEYGACERAARIGARFVNARDIPFMNCECGQVLDFRADESALVM
jgi:hypothetical protein